MNDTQYAMDIINARNEKHDAWQKGFIVFLTVALLVTNIFWVYREMQYQTTVTETYTTTSDGDSIFINGTGDINGKDNLQENSETR